MFNSKELSILTLDYFKVKQPDFLNDVKLQIKDIRYKKGICLNNKESIFTAYNYMMENNVSTIPIIGDNSKLIGIVSMKDIAKDQLSDNSTKLNTSFDNILETLKGKEVLNYVDVLVDGRFVLSKRNT